MNYHEMSSASKINCRESGLLLSGIIAAIYAFLLIRGDNQPHLAVGATVLAVLALFEALPLCKTIKLIINIGNGMHRFTNPLVFGLIYIVAVIPTALALKLARKNILPLCFSSTATSYWENLPKGKNWHKTFQNQF